MSSRNSQYDCIVPATVRCAICQVVKQSTNHWYLVDLDTAEHAESSMRANEIHIFAFSHSDALDGTGFPTVCGEACLLKLISANLDIIYPPLPNPIVKL